MKQLYTLILVVLIPLSLLSDEKVRLFKSVHFQGLKTLSKLDLARDAGMKSYEGQIAVDLDLLEKTLKNESVIRKYKLIDKNNILTIIVSEYSPEYVFFISGGSQNFFCEVDREFRIISRGKLHVSKTPVIILDGGALDGKKIRKEYSTAINLFMKQIRNNELGSQLKQVDFSTAGLIRVTLNGRRTEFVMSAERPEYERLGMAVGYLDAIKRYPATLDVRGRLAVIR
jgi:hypothetical protein